MTDVDVRFAPELYNGDTGRYGFARHPVTKELVLDVLAKKVAQEMDCLDDDGNQITHDWETQIAIPVFEPITGRSWRSLLIVISAYDWPDRMANINKRCERVGIRMRSLWGLGKDQVSVSFDPLPRGSTPEGGCWVSV